MAKIKHTTTANGNSVSFTNTNPTTTTTNTTTKNSNGGKMKRKRKSLPRDSPLQRSSVYRGVTRHRWTGRYEAHLWDKNCWNESQNKKGKQVYLGAYDGEEAAAHAYDLAALKYWGHETILNFPASTYEGEMKELEGQSKEEYIGSLRRKSSGFSRGVSKYRGVARHHHNGRWEARIGRVFGNKYLYLGTYATQEEAATAYDMAAIEYRGLNAVTNFDLSRYIKWLRPNPDGPNADTAAANSVLDQMSSNPAIDIESNNFLQHQQGGIGELSDFSQARPGASATASSALGLLFQSPKFKEMLERTSEASSSSSAPPPNCESRPSGCSFPEDIQTYFECEDTANFADGEDTIFGDLNQFVSSIFACELDA